MKKKYLPILLLIIFPFLLIKDLPLMWVRYFFATLTVIYLFYQAFTKYDFKKLGFFMPTKWDYFYFAFALSFLILSRFTIFNLPNFCPPEPLGFPKATPVLLLLLVYGLFNAIGQEIVYRSFLINYLEQLLNNKKIVFTVGAILFSILHVAYGIYFVLGALVVGFYFVHWFMRTKNVVLIILLHIPSSILAVYMCFI